MKPWPHTRISSTVAGLANPANPRPRYEESVVDQTSIPSAIPDTRSLTLRQQADARRNARAQAPVGFQSSI